MQPHRIHLFAGVALWAATLCGAETPIPESPTQWVTDNASFLSPQTVQTLNERLRQYEQRTGHQVIVYIAPTTGGVPIEDWAVRAFQKWKVGRKGLDDGLALFVFPQDRRLRIEVGYGLEPVVPDAIASRVINDVMVPHIQAGRNDDALTAGIDALTGVIDKEPGALPPPATPTEPRERSHLESIFWGVVGFLVLALMITHPRLALLFLMTIFSGGRGYGGGGGYSWGGGGFGGGGGRSGGGGASGSW